MPISLPQEVKTNKVQTLPDDLKSIAEEMLAAKFGVKEAAPKKAKSFRGDTGNSPWSVGGFTSGSIGIESASFMGGRGRRNGSVQVSVQPWNGNRVAEIEVGYPDDSSLVDAFRELDSRFGRDNRRKIIVGPRFFNELCRDPRLRIQMKSDWDRGFDDGVEHEVARIYNFPVIVATMLGNRCIVRDEF